MRSLAMDTEHPIRLQVTDDLSRSRLTTFFRLFLAIPHLIWVAVWGIAAAVAVLISWFATLLGGQTPDGLHQFIARYLRYATHVNAYFYLLADPYPGFLGDTAYPIDLVVAPPAPQRRVITAFRIILAIPVFIVANILGYLLQLLAVISWFVALFTARVPLGVRNLGAWCWKFTIQTYAYIGLLTERYPSFDGFVADGPRG